MKPKFIFSIFASLMLLIWPGIGFSAAKDLVAAWTFDEGAGDKVKDASGHGHDGVISGAKWVKGKFGAALEFNGDGDQVLVVHDEALNIQKQLTVEAWVYPTGWNPDLNAIAQKWEDGSNRRQYQLTVYKSKNWWYVSNAGNNWPRAEGQVAVELKQWTHLAGIYDGKKLRSYTNGKLDVELKQPNGIFSSEIPVVIGGYGPKTPKCTYGKNRHFKGVIDEVRFWNRALSEQEIQQGMKISVMSVDPSAKAAVTWADIKSQSGG